ncbi:MAG: hypothetical protein JO047_07590, partial [Alphaproteobacteria bacterium]|nr:hypothetical protein [Alphaproteobacteria bacterium]
MDCETRRQLLENTVQDYDDTRCTQRCPGSERPARGTRRWLPVLGLLALAAAGPPADAVVAQSGSVALTAGDIQAIVAQVDPEARKRLQQNPQALAELVRTRLLRMVLLEEAKAAKWDEKPEIARRAADAHDAVIVDTYLASLTAPDPSYPSEAEIQSAYEANKSRFMTPRQYRVAQIFLAVPADAPHDADENAQKKL